MNSRVASRVALLAAAIAVAACGAFGGSDGPTATDAGSDASSDSRSDYTMDSGPAIVDGGVGDASCSWFCESFDTAAWASGWGSPTQYSGGSLDRTTEVFTTPPYSLRSDLPSTSVTIAAGTLPRTRSGVVRAVHCEMSLRLESRGVDFSLLFRLDAQVSNGGPAYYVGLGDNGVKAWTELDEGSSMDPLGSPAKPLALALNTWTRIGLDVELGKPTVLTIDGAPANHPALSPSGDAGAATFDNVTLTLGAARTDGPGEGGVNDEWRVDYDDVACNVTK